MGSFQSAQLRYDNAVPDDDSRREEALQEWIECYAEYLVGGGDVMIRGSFVSVQGVQQDEFVEKVAEHLRSSGAREGRSQCLGSPAAYRAIRMLSKEHDRGYRRAKLAQSRQAL